jgi:hypothetical protein
VTLTTTSLVAAREPVSIQVTPSVSLAPTTLGIRVRIAAERSRRLGQPSTVAAPHGSNR